MMQEYANGYDLAVLLKARGKIRQEEARIIIRQVVQGIKDVWSLGIIHRDMKLANILLHFPEKPGIADTGAANHNAVYAIAIFIL